MCCCFLPHNLCVHSRAAARVRAFHGAPTHAAAAVLPPRPRPRPARRRRPDGKWRRQKAGSKAYAACGWAAFAAGNILRFVAMRFAAQTVLSGLGSLQFVIIPLASRVMLGIRASGSTALGVTVVLLGEQGGLLGLNRGLNREAGRQQAGKGSAVSGVVGKCGELCWSARSVRD